MPDDLDEAIRQLEEAIAKVKETDAEPKPTPVAKPTKVRKPFPRRGAVVASSIGAFSLGLVGWSLCDLADHGVTVAPIADALRSVPPAVWSIAACWEWLWRPVALIAALVFIVALYPPGRPK